MPSSRPGSFARLLFETMCARSGPRKRSCTSRRDIDTRAGQKESATPTGSLCRETPSAPRLQEDRDSQAHRSMSVSTGSSSSGCSIQETQGRFGDLGSLSTRRASAMARRRHQLRPTYEMISMFPIWRGSAGPALHRRRVAGRPWKSFTDSSPPRYSCPSLPLQKKRQSRHQRWSSPACLAPSAAA